MIPAAIAIRPRYHVGGVVHTNAHLPDREGDDKRYERGEGAERTEKIRLFFIVFILRSPTFFPRWVVPF